jgi:hypothetical protein
MKLIELFENPNSNTVAFCFGRMNPPTRGHAHLFEVMSALGDDYKIFVSSTQDKEKNPLTYEEKIKFIGAMNPKYASHVVNNKSLTTIIKVAVFLYESGYRNATFVAGSDRKSIYNTLVAYNGVEGKAHGFYHFDQLDFKSAGDRDPDADGIESISASTARKHAVEGNFSEFTNTVGNDKYSREMYNRVREGMGLGNETI